MAQTNIDSTEIDTPKVISYALDGNIPKVLELINIQPEDHLIRRYLNLKDGLNARFNYEIDRSNYLALRESPVDSLLIIFRNYWRKSFLDYPKVYDTLLRNNLVNFLRKNYPAAKKLSTVAIDKQLDKYLSSYIHSKGLYSAGFGKTGKFYDLLVWRHQTDTIYKFTLHGQKIRTPIVFMEDFVSLGWEEYATLDRAYPGGWAYPDKLYCVKKSYDITSETFLISYLAHEGRHFEDYKLFPKLTAIDLEYRAKLTELTLLDKTIFDIISFFITNADANTDDSHKRADYYAIQNLSKLLFNVEFEADIDKWKVLQIQTIHDASAALLVENTKELKKRGRKVTSYFLK